MEKSKTGNKILIITGGTIELEFLQERLIIDQYNMIIAADHGLLAADMLNLSMDYIVGDFDSVPEKILQKYREISTPIKTFPREKDKSDTQIALELALMHNPTEIHLIGATGTRLDHVLANLHLLMLPLQLGVDAFLMDPHNKIYLKKSSFRIIKAHQFGDYVSFLPFTTKVCGLTLKGFRYPLNNIILNSGSSLCISNEIKEEEAYVEFSEGILVVTEARD